MKGMIAFVLIAASCNAFADRVLLTGKPVELIVHPGYFTFPSSYTPLIDGYRFVMLMGTRRVCYLRKQPELAVLDTVQYVFEEKGKKLTWTCYQYDPKFFEIDF